MWNEKSEGKEIFAFEPKPPKFDEEEMRLIKIYLRKKLEKIIFCQRFLGVDC